MRGMTNFLIRRAKATDRPRLLEISSQIWEGQDYVPHVVDAWIADPASELAVAIEKDSADGMELLVGFARCSRFAPDYAWLEGARTDLQYRNRGASKALLNHFLAKLRSQNVRVVALSTYIENKASIHIIEREGFRRVGAYVYAERHPQHEASRRTQDATAEPGHTVVSRLGSQDVLGFLGSCEKGIRFIADGWKFIPLELGSQLVDSRIEFLGARRRGRISAVAAVSKNGLANELLSIGIFGEDPMDVASLLDETSARFPIEQSELMIWPSPASDDLLEIVRSRGYCVWNEGRGDVFVYQLTLAS